MNQMNQPLTPRGRSARDMAVAPLPPIVEGPNEPMIPLPPFVEEPQQPVAPLPPYTEQPGNPVIPLPPIVEELPGEPVIPLPPIVEEPQQPVWPGPGQTPGNMLPPIVVPPQQPVFPGYCTVRFLHAAANYEPVRVSIASRLVCSNLAFGALSSYGRVPDGFYTVTITTAASPRTLLYQSTIPFRSGDVATMAITRTANGIDLTRVSDMPCVNRPRNRACLRTVNLVYNSPALDMILNDGRVVFSDIRYKEITPFKLARPQEYGMYIAQTPYVLSSAYTDIETLEDLPIILANYYLPGYGNVSPLTSFYVDAKAGGMYTVYLLGAWNGAPAIRAKVVEDF